MPPLPLISRLAVLFACFTPFSAGAVNAPVVAGFERFNQDAREAGELLLGELQCVRCHQPEGDAATRITTSGGPALDAAGSRLRPDFLRRWLATPHEVKPGTTMPDVLGALNAEEKKTAIEALTHYLMSLRAKSEPKTQAGSVERGRHLYHQIGCVACHAPDADYVPETAPGVKPPKPELPSIPHAKLGEKYTVASLQHFLLNPLAARPGGRMPQIPMKPEEAADLAAYLTGETPSPAAFQPDAKLVSEGRKRFADLGCAACHTAPGIKFTPKAKPLAKLGTGGCLDAKPSAKAPNYSLDERQRTALLAALKQIAEPLTLDPAQSAQRLMTSLNCYACHARDQRGGAEPGRAVYFHTVGDVDLGDEGRIPPALTGVGAKLTPEAIERTVRGKGAVRPYMAVRMPNFGAAHASALAKHFASADYRPPTEEIVHFGRNTTGREIIGTAGLACIACHDLKGRKSLGVPAIDLAHAPKRLRRDWFHAYLIDPGKLRPGTRMPSFWPGGLPANPKWGKGEKGTLNQIDSLWVYLLEIDQSRLPEGMDTKGEFELKPKDTPIVFRTFMKDAGMQAVAVGFPQKIHAAFDSKNAHWALAWRGAFLDAEGTWEERAAPLAEPLSKDMTTLAKGAQFTVEPDAKAEVRFNGYRVDKSGVPTFLYRVGAVEIEDRVEPDAKGRALLRTLTLRGKQPLKFTPAPHEKMLSGAAGPVAFDAQGTAKITTEITW